jgi:subtilisin family serine protease
MKVTVTKFLNVRAGKPSVNAPCYQYLAIGSILEVDGALYKGDSYEGIDTWMKDDAGNYYWSGGISDTTAFTQQSPFVFDSSKVAPWSTLNFDISRFWPRSTGKNITIAVIDTGIFPHKDLKDAIDTVHQKSFISDSVLDTDGHGTHVSGIIAARGLSDILGVAPEARILPLKIVNSHQDIINTQHLIDAITYAISLDHVKIINISLITDSNENEALLALNSVIQQAFHARKIIVAASGNLAGNYISFPAKFENMISVSAIERDPNVLAESYLLLDTSNYGKGIKACCPGSSIISCSAEGAGTVEDTGTSMACAYMSGLIALKLQMAAMPDFINQAAILSGLNSSIFQQIEKNKNKLPVINPMLFINA